MIVAVFISDRRDLYLPRCLESFQRFVAWGADMTVVDDSAHELGMAGAVREGWMRAIEAGADYVFHVEEDFEFTAPIDLDAMALTLDANPNLAQLVLKRQPWSDEEKRAGGIVEMHPDDYTDRDGWLEHRRLFSLNPCLIPARTLSVALPGVNPGGVERDITDRCLAAGMSFGMWGTRDDPPRCIHIGEVRSAGYRW